MTVTEVEVNEVGDVPNKTLTVFVRFVPEMTVVVLPAVVPFVTDKLVITGALTFVLTFCEISTC